MNTKIIGLGEGGARTITRLIQAGVNAADCIAIGKDENILLTSLAKKNIFLNRDITSIYKNFADALQGSDSIFMTGGLASNAARIAAPIVTSCAKNAQISALMCQPFILENHARKLNAQYTLKNLRGIVDNLFVVPAEKFFAFRINQPQVSIHELFDAANDFFANAIKILLSIDLDLKFGDAAIGFAEGSNPLEAVRNAAQSPTINEDDIKAAQKVFVRLDSRSTLLRTEAALNFIKNQLQPDAQFLSKIAVSPALNDSCRAVIIISRHYPFQ